MERLTLKGYVYDNSNFIGHGILAMTNKLQKYEDAEEQGLLLRLPCKIGTLLYEAYNNELSGVDEHRLQLEDIPNFGKTVFLTREEAEQALAEMQKEI